MSILEKARSKTTIKTEALIPIIYKSHTRYTKIQKTASLITKAFPESFTLPYFEKNRVDQIKQGLISLKKLMHLKSSATDYIKEQFLELNALFNSEVASSISNIMVKPLLKSIATETQQKKWLPLLESVRCIGAYAQTELGHGSDVQGLETTAVFDKQKNCFILNSPSVSSYKWWPGELGVTCNIAIVYARLIIGENSFGVLPFIVKIRDFESHTLLEGVEVGDIGPKLGYHGKDNGFMKFDQFRVPFDSLLAKFFFVKGDRVVSRGNPKVVYAAMMTVRVSLLCFGAFDMAKALTIALRYSYLRKQFRNSENIEVPVIEYQTQQYKLFPLLAKTYVMQMCYLQIDKKILELNEDIKKGKFDNLQECHLLLCGSKSMFTQWVLEGLVTCVQCCGGHGFSNLSGIPHLIGSNFPNTILEGENTVLKLQIGRYLLKCLKYIQKGKQDKIIDHCRYLKNIPELEEFKISETPSFLKNWQNLYKLFQKCSFLQLKKIAMTILSKKSKKTSFSKIWNTQIGVKLKELADIHTITFTIDLYFNQISQIKDKNTKKSLTNLGLLYIMDNLIKYSHLFSSLDCITNNFLRMSKDFFEDLLRIIKDDCLSLVEVFVYDEGILKSAIGDVNEKPYENLYRMARMYGSVNSVDFKPFYLEHIRKTSLELYPKL